MTKRTRARLEYLEDRERRLSYDIVMGTSWSTTRDLIDMVNALAAALGYTFERVPGSPAKMVARRIKRAKS